MTELTPKGVRDFLPEEKIIRDRIIDILRKSFELYGYNPLETPALERMEILASKYAGGEEILKEIFKLKDQGGRELGLRYDLTVPFARVIAMNPNLKMPFKRYQIDRVWRDGPIKLGRYREFYQADADVVGIKSVGAEAEFLSLAKFVFDKLGFDIVIKINSIKILNSVLEILNIPDKYKTDFILSLDKYAKIGAKGVAEEIKQKGIPFSSDIYLLLTTLQNNSLDDLEKYIKNVFEQQNKNFKGTPFEEGFLELKEIFTYLKQFNVPEAIFDGTLARGLSYYTGTVYEVYLKKSQIKSSIAAGGRFDKMVGLLLERNEEVPAVGISFGIDVIADAIKLEGKIKSRKSVVDVYVVPIGDVMPKAISLLQALRKEGIKADMDLMGKGVTKNLSFANSYGIRYAIFLGENEIKEKKVKLRDMEKGEEKLLSVDEVVKILK